jgi:hypothetical protein
VRGHHEVVLRPTRGEFDEDCVALARDLLRHLDERLLTTVRTTEIAFSVHEDAPPTFATGGDLLRLMATKLREMLTLASECVESFATRPERALHLAQILRSLQEDDLSRLYHQAIRLVANLELPVTTVSDFQHLDLVAADLESAGRACVEVAHAVVAGYGLDPDDLARPRSDLQKRLQGPGEVPAVVHAILRTYLRTFEEAQAILASLGEAMQARDAVALVGLDAAARNAERDLNRRLFATVRDVVTDTQPLTPVAYTAYQIRYAAGLVLTGLGRAAERNAVMLAAAESEAKAG